MMYKITIEKKEKNPNFEAELKEWQDQNKYSNFREPMNRPQPEQITNALICELTEEQYKAIKAQVFNTFE